MNFSANTDVTKSSPGITPTHFFHTGRDVSAPGPITGYAGILALAFLGFVILADAFAAHFVVQEHYIYFWDWSRYWVTSLDFSTLLVERPFAALQQLIECVRSCDYNPLPVLALIPVEWLFGTSRLTYILTIPSLYLLPAAVVIA